MPTSPADLILDPKGRPVPQAFNETTDTWEAETGAGGKADVRAHQPAKLPYVDEFGARVDVETARINASATGDNPIVTADGTHALRVVGYAISALSAGIVAFKSGNTIRAEAALSAGQGASYAGHAGCPAFVIAAGDALNVNVPAGMRVVGHLAFVRVAV